jgi:heme/copper-type cytochrome/quinol oxidase subunit 1
LWLRRAWLWTIGCVLLLAGGSALLMRFDLMEPKPTLSPSLYGHAFGLHGVVAAGGLLAAMLAIPALVVKPGRGAVVLGFLALGSWMGAMAVLVSFDLRGAYEWPGFSPRSELLVLGASAALGAAQIGVSLLARPSRPQIVAAAGAITALAIVAVPLFGGALPSSVCWLLATTAVACGMFIDATTRGATILALVAIIPCLVLGWAVTLLVDAVPTDVPLHDTVAVLSPLPATGGAMLGALLVAATRWRTPSRRLTYVAVAVIAAGAGVTSLGFFVLGLRGLPRRYLAYLPEFQPLQILVGAAAVVTVVGCVMALEALRRGTRTGA